MISKFANKSLKNVYIQIQNAQKRNKFNNECFVFTFENTSSSNTTVKFFDITDTTQQPITRYSFVTPYAINYAAGTRYTIKVNRIDTSGILTAQKTASEFADILTALGYGTWGVNSSVSGGNIFMAYSNTNIFNQLTLSVIYYPTTDTTVGASEIKITSSINAGSILYSQDGYYTTINSIDVYSENISQLIQPIKQILRVINGNTITKVVTPILPPNQSVTYLESLDFKDMALNQISYIEFTLLANESVRLRFNYQRLELAKQYLGEYYVGAKKFSEQPTKIIEFREKEEKIINKYLKNISYGK